MPALKNEPSVVDASRGAAWWAEGWRLFTPAVWTWFGIVVVYGILSIAISRVPYVGSVGHWLLTPVFTAGLMVGCSALARGEKLRVAHLFEGFQGAHFVPLIFIGAINMAVMLGLAAVAAMSIIGGFQLSDLLHMGAFGDPFDTLSNIVIRVGIGGALLTLLLLTAGAVFAMLNWFAPALVILHGQKPVAAMKESFIASWRNWLPFLVYGVLAILMLLAVLAVFGALIFGLGATAIFGNNSGWGAMIGLIVMLGVVMFGVMLVTVPLVFTSTYASFRDIFGARDTPELKNPAYR